MSKGKLSFVGLGLYDEKDLSVKALEEIKKADKVFAEFYTSKMMGASVEKLENFFGKKITVLNREQTENGDILLDSACKQKTVFLTGGDSMTATTHVDLRIRAIQKDIETYIFHGSSIISAVSGLLGLQNYKFGRSTTLVYPEKNYFPTSPYHVIADNKKIGLHTLVLLDIQDDKNRYMTASEALDLLLKMEEKEKQELFNENTVVCVVARAGSKKPNIKADSIKNLKKIDFGPPLHTLVIPGNLHFMEIEALEILAQLPAQLGEKLQKP
jgi:diphthine synthase